MSSAAFGIHNPGTNCFLNALIQALLSLPKLTNELKKICTEERPTAQTEGEKEIANHLKQQLLRYLNSPNVTVQGICGIVREFCPNLTESKMK